MALVSKGFKRFFLFGVAPLLLAGGAVAWAERDTLLCYYFLHRLERAQGEDATVWAEKLAGLGSPAVPDVLALLSQDDADVCANARRFLDCLAERWGHGDPRCAELAQQTIKEFCHFSACGQRMVLDLAVDWLGEEKNCSEGMVCACGRLLADSNHSGGAELQGPAVQLALHIVAHSRQPDLLCAARELARNALQSKEPATRVRAVKLACQPGVELRKDTVPLLHDPEPLVRRAAILAVGEAPDVIDTDSLLNWLHDTDAEVRRLCEQALQGEARGLLPAYVRLGRLLTDPRWQVRVSVLDHLEDREDLDPTVWLRRLSHDPSPAIRAAAIRAACENGTINLTDRLEEMMHDDPSPTVAGLARHYLESRKSASLSRQN